MPAGRPKSKHKPVSVTITGTPKLGIYLDALVDEEGFGNSRAEVAKALVWSSIHELIGKGVLDRLKGVSDEDGPA